MTAPLSDHDGLRWLASRLADRDAPFEMALGKLLERAGVETTDLLIRDAAHELGTDRDGNPINDDGDPIPDLWRDVEADTYRRKAA